MRLTQRVCNWHLVGRPSDEGVSLIADTIGVKCTHHKGVAATVKERSVVLRLTIDSEVAGVILCVIL